MTSKQYIINVKDIEGLFWSEVDYIEDYERILKFRSYSINFSINITKDAIESNNLSKNKKYSIHCVEFFYKV